MEKVTGRWQIPFLEIMSARIVIFGGYGTIEGCVRGKVTFVFFCLKTSCAGIFFFFLYNQVDLNDTFGYRV